MDYGWIICCFFVIYTHWWLCCLVKVNIIFFTFFPRLLAWHKSDIFYPPPPHTYSFAGIMPDRVGGAPNGVVCPLSISILLRVLCTLIFSQKDNQIQEVYLFILNR